MGQTGKIRCQRLGKLLLADNPLVKDKFLHRREAVAKVGDAHL